MTSGEQLDNALFGPRFHLEERCTYLGDHYKVQAHSEIMTGGVVL